MAHDAPKLSKRGRAGEGRPRGFAAETATATGLSKSQINRLIAEPKPATGRQTVTVTVVPEQGPMSRAALWLWGRLLDFERDGILSHDQRDLQSKMTDSMKADVLRLSPLVADWLVKMNASQQPAAVKKKRGRPPGSKNKPKPATKAAEWPADGYKLTGPEVRALCAASGHSLRDFALRLGLRNTRVLSGKRTGDYGQDDIARAAIDQMRAELAAKAAA